jgi:chorismate synthase
MWFMGKERDTLFLVVRKYMLVPRTFATMPGNTFGQIFRLTTFGESHGPAIGGVIDGCPAGLKVDHDAVQAELDRRRPGSTTLGTARTEGDEVEFLSGLFKNTTLGTPIGFLIRNKDVQSADYDHLKDVYRPSHGDLTWELKFGIRDHRGGGRSSARETASRVVGGAIARLMLKQEGVQIDAYVSGVGEVLVETEYDRLDLPGRWNDPVRCPDPVASHKMRALIEQVRTEGDSIGGSIRCVIRGCPPGLGEPVFDKLNAELGRAMLGINAVKAFSIGSGQEAARMRGSQHNDAFTSGAGRIRTATNRSGGIQGGISNGEDILMEIHFKPVATIAQEQATVDASGKEVKLAAKGRHDPCVVPRAVPIVESMACLVIADHLLRQRMSRV